MLLDLKVRGMNVPKLAIGDGALGFSSALDEICQDTRHQRCWVHKSANVLNALRKAVQAKAKEALHEIWMAETQADAQRAFDQFIHTYQDKYPKAIECATQLVQVTRIQATRESDRKSTIQRQD